VERMVCLIQETTERIHELAAISFSADEMNNSLLATKNASLYHHSLDTPYCKMECSERCIPECFIMFLNIA
jgi:hypothetical protein